MDHPHHGLQTCNRLAMPGAKVSKTVGPCHDWAPKPGLLGTVWLTGLQAKDAFLHQPEAHHSSEKNAQPVQRLFLKL